MQLKDYYTILELPPSASPDEIKKAYRRLAHQYHPDKNANDPYAIAKFTEIKEAYETLTNPAKKDFYLQQRWYTQSMGKRTTSILVTPVIILKQLLELDRYSSKLDIHRMDKEGLYQYISYVLSDDNIRKLNEFKEADTNKEIIFAALKTASLLSYPFMRELGIRLQKIESIDEAAIRQIDQLVHESRRAEYWEKRRVAIVIVIVVILCVSIFITAKN